MILDKIGDYCGKINQHNYALLCYKNIIQLNDKWSQHNNMVAHCLYKTYLSLLNYKQPKPDEKQIWCWGNEYELDIFHYEYKDREIEEITGSRLDFLNSELAKHLLVRK